MKIFYQILQTTILCYLLSNFPVNVCAGRRRIPNRLQQKRLTINNVKELTPRIPRFGGGNSTEDGQVYMRLGSGSDADDPFASFTKTTTCGTTYLVEDGHTAMMYSRHDRYAYKCHNTFRAAGVGSKLHMVCPNYGFRFNCYFESLTIKADGVSKQYCRRDSIPPATSQEIQFSYKRNLNGFNGGYICMMVAKGPQNSTVTGTSGSEQQCGVTVSMEQKTNDNHRVVGGHNADRKEHPWMAFLKMVVGKYNYEYRCGGSLITTKHILSAAHCFYGYDIKHIEVALGKHDITTSEEDGSIWRRTTDYKVHSSYDDELILNDIAIVTLKEAIVYSEFIRPICLPAADITLPKDADVVASGWGALSYGGHEATILQEVSLNIQSSDACEDAWQKKFNDNNFAIFDSQVCARGEAKDTCSGDSGGPLFFKVDNKWVLVGITSFGHKCADPDVAGVYSRVSAYIGWINENIEGN